MSDARESARRARVYNDANIWNRADKELDEVHVILTKAREARDRIHSAYRAAVAVLAEMRPDAGGGSGNNSPASSGNQGSNLTAATQRVDQIGAVLAAADRDVEIIEQSIVALLELNLPNRR